MPFLLRCCAVLLSAVLLAGCDAADVVEPEGTYTSTRFVLTPEGEAPVDLLAGGAALALTLRDGGAFTGSLFIPAAFTEPDEGDLDADFAGTYTIVNDAVAFTTDADLFVRDATWTLRGDRLSTTYDAGDAVLSVELER